MNDFLINHVNFTGNYIKMQKKLKNNLFTNSNNININIISIIIYLI